MSTFTQRKRVSCLPHELEPGEYCRDETGEWWCKTPNGLAGRLTAHVILEYPDGTITCSPSILVTHYDGKSWHGFLENGVWREV